MSYLEIGIGLFGVDHGDDGDREHDPEPVSDYHPQEHEEDLEVPDTQTCRANQIFHFKKPTTTTTVFFLLFFLLELEQLQLGAVLELPPLLHCQDFIIFTIIFVLLIF